MSTTLSTKLCCELRLAAAFAPVHIQGEGDCCLTSVVRCHRMQEALARRLELSGWSLLSLRAYEHR